MSSNECASFIPRSRGVCTSIKKNERKREKRRWDREKRKERKKNENPEKARRREAAAGVEKLGARIMEYVGSKGGEENGVRVAYD